MNKEDKSTEKDKMKKVRVINLSLMKSNNKGIKSLGSSPFFFKKKTQN